MPRGYTFVKRRACERIVFSELNPEYGELCEKCGFRRKIKGKCVLCRDQKRIWRELLLADTPEAIEAINDVLQEKDGEEFLVGCFEE